MIQKEVTLKHGNEKMNNNKQSNKITLPVADVTRGADTASLNSVCESMKGDRRSRKEQ